MAVQALSDYRPLQGVRVLLTRPTAQVGHLVRKLELLGAVPCVLPVINIAPPVDWGPVDRAIESLPSFTWVVFTSSNGVDALIGRLHEFGRDTQALARTHLAAIGPSTAKALEDRQLQVDLVPAEHNSEGLAAALLPLVTGKKVLLPGVDRGRDVLRRELSQIADVTHIIVYRQVDLLEGRPEIIDPLRRGEIDYVTLTSANIARGLLEKCDETVRARVLEGKVRLVTISPITSAAVGEFDLPVAAEAVSATEDGLIAALVADHERRQPDHSKSRNAFHER